MLSSLFAKPQTVEFINFGLLDFGIYKSKLNALPVIRFTFQKQSILLRRFVPTFLQQVANVFGLLHSPQSFFFTVAFKSYDRGIFTSYSCISAAGIARAKVKRLQLRQPQAVFNKVFFATEMQNNFKAHLKIWRYAEPDCL